MAVKIELKRSAVPGKVPTVNQLDLGELAINTYDGTVYLKQDTTVSQSIVQIATTAGSGSNVQSASYAAFASNAGYATDAGNAATANFATSASHAQSAVSSSYAITSTYALTASSADDFTVRGTLTAQKIVVQTITSSQELVTGSLIVQGGITGSLLGTASFADSGSYAVSASEAAFLNGIPSQTFATTGSNKFYGVQDIHSTSSISEYVTLYRGSGSGDVLGIGVDPVPGYGAAINVLNSGQTTYSKLNVTATDIHLNVDSPYGAFLDALIINQSGSVIANNGLTVYSGSNLYGNVNVPTGLVYGTASWAISASHAPTALSASYAISSSNAVSSSYAISASFAVSSSNAVSSSYAISASYAISSSHAESSSYSISSSNAISSSYAQSASYAVSSSHAISSSYAISASYSISGSHAQSSSYALTASYAATASSADSFLVRNSLTASGLHYPAADNGKFSFIQTDGAGNLSLQYVKTLYQNIRNMETSSIQLGTPLFISGSTGDNANAYFADAGNPARMPVTLIAGDNLAPSATGKGIILGHIEKVDTNAYPAGTEVYVAVGGGWTATRPTGSAIVQPLGVVTRQGNNGMGIVLTVPPPQLPNTQAGYMWIGNENQIPIQIATSSIQNVVSASYTSFAETIASGLNITASNILVNNSITASSITALSASFGHVTTVTGSAVIIGNEYIVLNTQAPAARYAGMLIYDSGSNATASVVWDSETNHFVYQNTSGTSYTGGGFLAGPRNTGSLADVTYPTLNRIVRGQGGDHLYDANIIDDDITVSIGIPLVVSGSINANSFTGSVSGTASWSSNSVLAGYALGALSASNAETASYAINASIAVSSSYALSSSYAKTASYAVGTTSASHAIQADNAVSSSYTVTASYTITSSNAISSSYAQDAANSISSSYALTASYFITSSVTSASFSISSSYATTASYSLESLSASLAQLAISSSYATTASFALNGGGSQGVSAIYIADEGLLQGTASYFDFTGAGVTTTVIAGTASINIPGGGGGGSAIQGASQVFTQSIAATTWSFAHSINSRTPVVEVYDSNFNVIIPTNIYNPGPFQTNIYFDVAESGYAIISTGGVLAVSGANAILNQTLAATTWSFTHDLHTQYPVFTIYDINNDVIVPQRIHVLDTASAEIYFSTPRTGKAVASLGGNIESAVTSSYSTTASYALTASYAANVPLTASYALTASYLEGSSPTASYAISASYATYAGNSPGYTVHFSQSIAATTWSFTHNLNTRNPIVQVYDSAYKQIIPNDIVGIDVNTAEVRFDYAETGYVVMSNGGGLYVTGSTSELLQTSAATTWSFTHNLNSKYINFEVYDLNDYVIIPSGIKVLDTNNAELYFAYPQTGRAVAQFSGINGAPNATTASYALTATSASYSLSGSYVVSASYANNATNANTASFITLAQTASYVQNAQTASYVLNAVSASYSISSSHAAQAISASYALTASFALTASSALNASDILIYVKNMSGAQINKGTVVRISGAVGNNPLISTASYTDDDNSANTLGITNENIANDSFGYVMTEGKLLGIDTSIYSVGQLLYLGANGALTGSAPQAPLHAVRLGQVLRSQLNNGSMYVRIDNGYELGELHDVRDTSTTASFGDLLVRSGSIWTNSRQLTGSYGLTGSLNATSLTGSIQVNGNSTYSGSQTFTTGFIVLTQVSQSLNFVDDTAAAAGGVPLGGLYRNGNFIAIRIS